MIGLTPVLGLLYLAVGATTVLAAPTPHAEKRHFNLRQKWQRDELNCVQILNPTPGAAYHPGFFVHMRFGTEQCAGVTAATPWTIHLYNNPDIQGEKLRYDYHEVIADGINQSNNQFVWNIPATEGNRVKNVKMASEYYIRIETASNDGLKLVGNAGPFTIDPDRLLRRDDPDAQLQADFALKPPSKPPVPDQTEPQIEVPLPVDIRVDPPTVEPSEPPTEAPSILGPVTPVNITGSKVQVDTPPNPSVFPSNPPPSTSQDLGLTDNNAPKPPVTEIATSSIIPNKLIVAGAVAGGAAGLGILGGTFFGNVGTVLGTIVGGVVGGLAVAVSYLGVPV
ncbi:hypothetical protein B0O80DRAFT_495064 [Mortierella sp. GBAus27b]|nr:hypothetical protein BGX31_009555 [Mortierella sp. GBA43]KAI8359542.1 hypothetical protein B0O80DRAFT_495064 [Mortierella sp. GBAus27b]